VEINLYNHTSEFVVLFSVHPMIKKEREEGVVPPGVSMTFYVPGMPGTELRIKDYNTKATLHTYVATAYRGSQGVQWEEQGNPEHFIALNISAVTVAKYTHVQFISWEVYTGPNRGQQPWSMNRDGISYTGIGNAVDNRLDIKGQLKTYSSDCNSRTKQLKKPIKWPQWSFRLRLKFSWRQSFFTEVRVAPIYTI
jgi:hypothetical protein